MIEILDDWCKGCEICVNRCPVQALEISEIMNKKGVRVPRLKAVNKCYQCRLCEQLCPDFAITVTKEEKEEGEEKECKLIIGGVCAD